MAVIAFLAALIPSIAEALDVQTHVDELKRVAAEYKALQDHFWRLARITALSDVDEAEKVLAELMNRMDAVRSSSITPQRYLNHARRQIESGNHDFAVGLLTGETPSGMRLDGRPGTWPIPLSDPPSARTVNRSSTIQPVYLQDLGPPTRLGDE